MVDRHLVARRRLRRAASFKVADRRLFDALLQSDPRMRMPFVLRLPVLPGAKDRELGEPRRHAGLKAQIPPELLCQHAEYRRMQENCERPLIAEAAARAG